MKNNIIVFVDIQSFFLYIESIILKLISYL
jgi:hypothetical protein